MLTTLLSDLCSGLGSWKLRARAAGLAVAVFAAACGSDPSDQAMDREVFVQTYVDLRVAALDTDSQRLADPDREAVLRRHGVTADDLTRFVETHASNLDYMRDVWNDIELRLDRTPERD